MHSILFATHYLCREVAIHPLEWARGVATGSIFLYDHRMTSSRQLCRGILAVVCEIAQANGVGTLVQFDSNKAIYKSRLIGRRSNSYPLSSTYLLAYILFRML